ncbi:pyridine nucleotide-disulfide oxidoreductase [Brachybacterium sp. HMSC06H03]|uniref:dihydrolipoyl dehydrogenase family protein n=1 Tax=Brachybacterium sp. HMSC06H03 TaxID=1581127 RepID=UPI0008A3AFA1|nr:NAD(P)/FAD-dependent oxidoreductase [Brachybacterium sp. HMSC06H03]OFT60206.1 pyridine nucleotide-disulfide oxidoreductase [Brachybacterium sp. HMSC06H03]
MTADAPSPDAATSFDVIVLGGGAVGENVAQYATEGTDLTAAIVEGELLGGECSYYACMPSKALLRPLAVADAAAHLPGITTPEVDAEALLARRDTWVSHYSDEGQVSWAEGAGLHVVRGHGRLVGEREVEVVGADGRAPQRLVAERAVVLATGSVPRIPAQLRDLAPWTSRDATGVVEVPDELVIVGGGVVAVEAATWMAALGSRVTMLARGDALLRGLEPFAGRHVLEALRGLGVDVRLGASVLSGSREDARETGLGRVHGGRVRLEAESDGRSDTLEADEVLVATGRRPRLDDVGLETVGLSPEDVTGGGTLPDWLHAVGDASGEAPLTHWGKYRARVIGQRILAAATGETAEPVPDQVPVPQVVFTDPQVAAVGLTEAEAREAGHQVVTAQVPFGGAAGSALLRDDVDGTAQIVVDLETRTLVGATFVGPEASELLHAATIAIVGAVPVHVLRHAVPSYPAASELWLRLLEELPRELRAG